MKLLRLRLALSILLVAPCAAFAQDEFLSWSASHAEAVGKVMHVTGRVGSLFDGRLLKTERSFNYKLAATWMTPDVIRASARLLQLAERLSDDSARKLVADAEREQGIVVMVEIDPREGSGVIPNDWSAFLQPVTNGQPVRGVNTPRLRDVRPLAGVLRRNYDYDRFWMLFPLKLDNGAPLVPSGAAELELIVRIYDREGAVRWPIKAGIIAP